MAKKKNPTPKSPTESEAIRVARQLKVENERLQQKNPKAHEEGQHDVRSAFKKVHGVVEKYKKKTN